jgi:hypothetical protein
MDPTLQYAQQVGLLGPTSVASPGLDPSTMQAVSSPAPEPQSQFSPITGTLTDEDILAAVVPGYMAQDSEPGADAPPSPAPSEPVTSPGPQPVTTKVKAGSSVGTSGFSAGKNAQVRRGPGSALDQRIAAINAAAPEQAAAAVAPFQEATDAQQAAAQLEIDATAKHILAEGHQKKLLADLQNQYDGQTNELIATEQGRAQEAKANYVSALNEFRAARGNPAQLWDNMSGGEQLGTLAVAFVQDFLGSQGIHTSAMSTLNKAIDRNIDAQVRAIQQKGQVAEGFKTLWDMQMAESSSMEETRKRMRGFMLESAKTAIESHMSQFDAALATAKGQAMIAKLDQELAKNIFDVNKHQDAMTSARINQELQRYGDELRASMESARISVAREANRIERDKMKAQQGPGDPYAGLIFDTSDSGQGAARWEFNSDIKDSARDKYRESQASTDHITKLSREYQSLARQFGQHGLTSGTRWSDDKTERLRAIAGEITQLRALALTGKAANETELKMIKSATPQDLFAGRLNIAPVIAQTERHMRDQLEAQRRQIARPLHEKDPRRTLSVPSEKFGEVEHKESQLIETSEADKKDIQRAVLEGRLKLLEKHGAYEPVSSETPSDVRKDHEQFLAEHPDLAAAAKTQAEIAPGSKSLANGPMQFEATLTGVARDAIGNKEKAAEGSAHDRAMYDEKVKVLRHVASGLVTNPDDIQAMYALYQLHKLGEDAGLPGAESPEVPYATTAREEMPR